jgi:uncharacterized protein YaiL (DUF2058 family)
MSMSLRDQLLAAGLVSQKQARDAERQQQHHQQQKRQQQPKKKAEASVAPAPVAVRSPVQSAKVLRDQALNKKQQEKAQKKALLAQIKQLVEQNRLAPIEGGESYNFVDGNKIRRIGVDASVRARLTKGEIAIVRHGGGYDLVPNSIVERIRERDPNAIVATGPAPEAAPADDAYKDFAVPDDLMW